MSMFFFPWFVSYFELVNDCSKDLSDREKKAQIVLVGSLTFLFNSRACEGWCPLAEILVLISQAQSTEWP